MLKDIVLFPFLHHRIISPNGVNFVYGYLSFSEKAKGTWRLFWMKSSRQAIKPGVLKNKTLG
jgi:hypothetical protein